MKSGKLLVFSGPSGVGKGTILHNLVDGKEFAFSVSMTTRAPREGEVDGKDYYFVSEEKFKETIEKGGFLEYVHKFQKSYGTPKAPIEEMLSKGINVILDIEMEGGLNVKKLYPDTVMIFVLPPSLKTLKERLLFRGTETFEQIEMRAKDIQKEIAFVRNYEYYIINDDIESAVLAAKAIAKDCGEEYKIKDAEAIINKYKENK